MKGEEIIFNEDINTRIRLVLYHDGKPMALRIEERDWIHNKSYKQVCFINLTNFFTVVDRLLNRKSVQKEYSHIIRRIK